MPINPAIKSVKIWYNPTPKASGPRYDADIHYHDGGYERITGVTDEHLKLMFGTESD